MTLYPTFLINGLLDSGKTSFIIDTTEKDGFYKKGKTLILQCEEGEIEYDPKSLKKYHIDLYTFENQEDFTKEKLSEVVDSFCPDRVVIEMNGMWDFTKIEFPGSFKLSQTITFIDFTTFPVYYNNMRQRFIDMIKISDLVVFNRCDDTDKLGSYQTNIKMVNSRAQYIAMKNDGSVVDAFEEPLPYDVDAPVILISDDDYARWYIDTFDHVKRYEFKVVEFNGQIVKSRKLPKDSFIVGRQAMTCCSNDIQLYGHLCNGSLGKKLKDKSWIHIKAKITYEFSKEYNEEEVVLVPIEISSISEIPNALLDLR
jgi:putative membrane protein